MKSISPEQMVVGQVYSTVKHPTVALTLNAKANGELWFTAQAGHPYKEDEDNLIRFAASDIGFINYPSPDELIDIFEKQANGISATGSQIEIKANSPLDRIVNEEAGAIIFLYQKKILDVRMMPAVIAGYHSVFGDKTSELLAFFTRNHPEIMRETLRQAFRSMMDDDDDDK